MKKSQIVNFGEFRFAVVNKDSLKATKLYAGKDYAQLEADELNEWFSTNGLGAPFEVVEIED